ncbi:MAG: DUF6702 family protein [Saprospiraceae bacterium]
MNIFFSLLILFHAFYISVIEIEVDSNNFAKATIKLFADDVSDAVRAHQGDIISRNGKYQKQEIKYLEHYFEDHFFIHNNIDTVRFKITSHTTEDQTVWINLISRAPITHKSKFTASYLIDIFPDQINMIHLTMKGEKLFAQVKKGKVTIELWAHSENR